MRPHHAALLLLLTLPLATAAFAGPAFQLTATQATYIHDGKPAPTPVVKDRFGLGLDGIPLWGPDPNAPRDEVRYVCTNVPEGDYTVGIATMGGEDSYLGFGDVFPERAQFYLNDTRLPWTAHTIPFRASDGPQPTFYQAEMLTAPVHVRTGDTFRVMVDSALYFFVGPMRLYQGKLDMPTEAIPVEPDLGPTPSLWLFADWTDSKRTGDTVAQTCRFRNPGVLPRTITVTAEARDWMMRPLLDREEKITIAPGDAVTKTFEFKPGATGRARLFVTATSPDVPSAGLRASGFPPMRLTKFVVDDLTSGSRPTLALNGDWEMCYVPGVDVGKTPPADAKWMPVKVPSEQPTTKGHCAWFRRSFDAPTYLTGERFVLNCDEILSTAAVYLNGTFCGECRRGSEPFEIDVTAGFKPGQRNEILIACQDWLAFSPRNRDRVLRGEEPVYKDGMIAPADYDAVENIGIRGPIRLEARPAVSVDDVAIVTSVRQSKLSLVYRLINKSATDQRTVVWPRVLDAGEMAMSLPSKAVVVPAGGTANVTIEAPALGLHEWWPDDPHLYVLETDLQPSSGARDTHLERFGFREFWIDGIKLVLNGTPVKLRSCCVMGAIGRYAARPFSDPDKRYEAIWNWQVSCKRDRDLQLVRTHLWSRFREGVDLADETGLMVKLEGGVHQVSFTLDDTFWKAVQDYETRLVGIYKNHASVMMWSAGNENMWGMMYQGEAARIVGNRWQVKIAGAMRDADPMHRPVEWEADGDLMGGSTYYALHYPRELSAFPDLPNAAWWGPLDKRTVVPYSMGPITLGTKPLTVGESFWPLNMAHPYGQSIVLGDDAYRGGEYEWKGWVDASRFFLNGFRDVEFGLVDTYLPLAILPPQTFVVRETSTSFFGGQKITRDVNVHSDVFREAKLTFRWSLTASSTGAKIAGATLDLPMQPAELKRLKLEVQLPLVTKLTDATFRADLFEGTKLLHSESSAWRIYPVASLKAPAGLKLSVYDPGGTLASLLTAQKLPFTRMTDLAAPTSGALILGPDSLKQDQPGPWREALASFVRDGGKLVILNQTDAPDFLPVPLTVARDTKSTMSFARAADHPLLAGLTMRSGAAPADLSFWYPDHYVSRNNYRKPVSGNWLPIVDIGTMDGTLEMSLLEEYDGRGCIVLCQMPLVEKATVCPQAAILLQNMLDYLAEPKPFRVAGKTALLAGTNEALRKALDENKLEYETLGGDLTKLTPANFQVAIVDVATALDDASAQALRTFAQGGGKVLLHRATPAKTTLLEMTLGVHLNFSAVEKESHAVQNRVFRMTGAGLLSGVSNHEFFWGTKRYIDLLRREGWWWSDCGQVPSAEMIAEYFCEPAAADRAKVVPLTRPGTLLQVPVPSTGSGPSAGQGYFLVSQFRLDEPVAECAVTVSRLRSLLLCNLGCTLKAPGGASVSRAQRFRDYDFFSVDLTPYANRGLRDDKAAGVVGWTNQGENDMRGLPTDRQVFGGVPFQIAAPKSVIALHSTQAGNLDLPREVKGIKVGRRADVLFFLHTIAFDEEKAKPFAYRVNYADGTSVDLPITHDQQVVDWWADTNRYAESLARGNTFVAFQGDNPMHKGVSLFCYEWVNPHPDREVRDVDFFKVPESGDGVVPVLLGITGATVQPTEGVVVDVIGTAGLKIKLGSQVQDIYYIGVVGLPADSPFYARAVADHKALAVGQKVFLRDDVNARNQAGQRIAYVFLATENYENLRNLLNAKILGDGLGSLGNFEGNNQHRMYLENLGFIAKQGRKGMWGTP